MAVTTEDVERSLPVWAAVAAQDDELQLALELDAQAATPAAPEVRARLLLLAERPEEAEALLAAHSEGFRSTDQPRRWAQFLVLACRSARGDRDAHRAMLAAAVAAAHVVQPSQLAYVVGAAADQHGDRETAAQAWSQLVLEHGVHTPLTIARFSASQVGARDRMGVAAALRSVVGNAANFGDSDAEVASALEAVRLLESRGDLAGARLLLRVLTVRLPHRAELAEAADRLEPREAMRTYRLKAVGAAALVMAPFASLGLFPLIALAAGRLLWRRFARVPGLGAVDSRVWMASREATQERATRLAGLVGGVLGLALGASLALPTLSLLGQDISSAGGREVSDLAEGVTFSVLMLLGLLAGARGGRWISALLSGRQRARTQAQVDRRTQAEARSCRCWQVVSLRGSFAAAYLQHHLAPAPTASLPLALSAANVLTCPTTGVLWLRVGAPVVAEPVALRGMVPEAPGAEDQPTGHYL